MRKEIVRLNIVDMAWLLLLFEGATLLVLGITGQYGYAAYQSRGILDHLWVGAVVGIFGTIIALGLWHLFNLRIRGRFSTGPFAIKHISVIPAAIANAIFLFTLWTVFDLIDFFGNSVLWYAVLGFLGTAIAIIVLIALYRFWPLKIKITTDKQMKIVKASLWVGIIAGIYEAVILPLMVLLFQIPLPPVPSHVVTGVVSGFVGGLVGTFIVNLIAPRMKIWLDLQ